MPCFYMTKHMYMLSYVVFVSYYLIHRAANEETGKRLMTDSARLLELWCKALGAWAEQTLSQEAEVKPNQTLFGDVASGCLFLLSSHKSNIIAIAVKAVRPYYPTCTLHPDRRKLHHNRLASCAHYLEICLPMITSMGRRT